MKSAQVHITAYQGDLELNEYTFDQPVVCVVGRADDCEIKLPPGIAHADVSRHHCVLQINPPDVQIRDLGSLNGTFVNGKKIGQRSNRQPPDDANVVALAPHSLKDGDQFRVGSTCFQVEVAAAPAHVWPPAWMPAIFG
jgi:pSer/pThr/pTyr-binding forkhead associated (FHA) protein